MGSIALLWSTMLWSHTCAQPAQCTVHTVTRHWSLDTQKMLALCLSRRGSFRLFPSDAPFCVDCFGFDSSSIASAAVGIPTPQLDRAPTAARNSTQSRTEPRQRQRTESLTWGVAPARYRLASTITRAVMLRPARHRNAPVRGRPGDRGRQMTGHVDARPCLPAHLLLAAPALRSPSPHDRSLL